MTGKQNTCCFTGHRPQKLSFGYGEGHPDCRRLKVRLIGEIDRMRKNGVTAFMTGMAQGVDLIAAELVLDLRRAYPEDCIRLVAVLPYEGQADRWNEQYRERYFTVLSEADDVIPLQKRYTGDCMQKRNRYLVDAAAHLIAVCAGIKGGTKDAVDYAVHKGLEVVIINPDTLEREHFPAARPSESVTRRFLR
jgi:uncharacterized phage-like protein YoqJ